MTTSAGVMFAVVCIIWFNRAPCWPIAYARIKAAKVDYKDQSTLRMRLLLGHFICVPDHFDKRGRGGERERERQRRRERTGSEEEGKKSILLGLSRVAFYSNLAERIYDGSSG